MNTNTFNNQSKELSGAIFKRFFQIVITILVQAAILFIASGRLDWVMAWVYLGVNVGMIVINTLLILPKNPELIAERAQIKEGAKSWDKVLAFLVAVVGPVIGLIVVGLDMRFGWSPQLILAIQLVALVFFVLGCGLSSWAMVSNKYFSGVVRIQKDRGHTVVTTGPYRFVRHPGYVSFIIMSLTTPLLLGSLWALIPAALTICLLVVRTALEDRTLQNELDGYKDYTRRVRYRLLPGIW